MDTSQPAVPAAADRGRHFAAPRLAETRGIPLRRQQQLSGSRGRCLERLRLQPQRQERQTNRPQSACCATSMACRSRRECYAANPKPHRTLLAQACKASGHYRQTSKLELLVQQRNRYLVNHARVKVRAVGKKVLAKVTQLKAAAWMRMERAGRSLKFATGEAAQTEAARLDLWRCDRCTCGPKGAHTDRCWR